MSCPDESTLIEFAAGSVEPAARARLEAHLVSCERCRVAVAALTSQTARTPRSSTIFGEVLARGQQVGRYVVLELVGEGAMGRVYGAYDPVLDRKVALKFIHPLHDDAAARDRLQREARAMARVSHPHLVAVHDAGEHAGSVFITMEFVEGVTLRAWLSRQTAKRARGGAESGSAGAEEQSGSAASDGAGLAARAETSGGGGEPAPAERDEKASGNERRQRREEQAGSGAGHGAGPAVERDPHRGPRVNRRTPDELVRAFLQAGEGLAAAHAAGLVHRDFKPENVLVGGDDRVRVSDFGLAREASEEERGPAPGNLVSERSRAGDLTLAGALIGTPAYMAPEQVAGHRADAQSDQFSFCVALYEAFAGKRPFERNAADLVRAGAPPISAPPRVQRVLSRGLQANPADRFPDMTALLTVLRGERRAPRSAIAVASAAVVAAVLAVSFAVSSSRSLCSSGPERVSAVWSDTRRESLARQFVAAGGSSAFGFVARALDDYGHAWAAMHRETCEATRVRGEQPDQVLAVRMACLDRRLVELEAVLGVLATNDERNSSRAADAVAGLTPLSVCANVTALLQPEPLPENPQRRAQVLEVQRDLARALALKDNGRFKEGLPIATAAALKAHSIGFPPLEAEALLLRGELADASGDIAGAEPMLRDAWAAATRARDDRLATRSAVSLSFVLSELTRMRDSDEWVWQADTMLQRVGGDFDLEARVANQQGHLLYAKADFAGAEARYRHAWELRKKNQGEAHPMTATMLANVGNAVGSRDDFEGALVILRQVRATLEPAMGASHPKVVQVRNAIVSQLLNLERNDEALKELDALLPVLESSLGRSHALVGRLVLNRSHALWQLHRLDEAREAGERALAIFEDAKMNLMIGESLLNLGRVLGDLTRVDDAVAKFSRSREVLTGVFGDGHEEISAAWEAEGEMLLAAGRPKQALAAFDEALERRVAAHGEAFAENAFALSGKGRAQLALGNKAAALAPLLRASELLRETPLSEELAQQTAAALTQARAP